MITKFTCNLCRNNAYVGSRNGIRNHLKEEHRILKELFNTKPAKGENSRHMQLTKQDFITRSNF